ncbi:hypothetical protein CKAN_02127700 [Cinnamomum micranthum f. kanehirae]|uniref:28S ribosomal protein S34, mitochondrial n=1 Tax=Cinnamomum micranthum f. kanehirae TaxID=337451 RepID=A0A443PMS8_9MAGN|nr:hypothetical protein CKAN_02127700 [Cinnamomum micranthum f. kanehirae]
MATVAAKGASMSTPIALFRNSFSNLIRTFSASAPSSSPSAAVTKKPKRKKKKNLFELAQFLPNWGIGYQMAKNHWQGISYQITKINLYKDGKHGKAWGVFHKDGAYFFRFPLTISPFC